MRVLHIDSEMGWRGGENQLRLLVEGLNKEGVENYLAARPHSEISKRGKDLFKGMLQAPLKGSLDFSSAAQIARFCRAHHIDIIDAQTSLGHSLGMLSLWFYGAPKLIVHRRVDNPPGKSLLGKRKYLSPKVSHYVAISQAIRNILLTCGVDHKDVTTVPSATDPRPFQGISRQKAKEDLANAFSLDPSYCFIGNASALSPQKGHETLIRAVGKMKKQGLSVHGFIAGAGEQQEQLDRLRLELGLDHDITFLGFVEDVPTFLSAIDILAVPSRNEGLGTIILDGIHAGCCVCASDVGGIPEMITDQETGLLCPADDIEAWVHALGVLANDVGLRERLAAAARAHIQEKFSLEAMVMGNLAVYQRVLGISSPIHPTAT